MSDSSFSDLGSLTIGPSDIYKDLGPITLPEGHDTLWLDVTQLSPTENWQYSYGLVSFLTSEGAELGTSKVYGNQDGEKFTLGIGLPPLDRTGLVRFTPRHYNLKWVSTEGAPNWVLAFKWRSGVSCSGGGGFGSVATLGVFGNFADTRVSWAIEEPGAKVRLEEESTR